METRSLFRLVWFVVLITVVLAGALTALARGVDGDENLREVQRLTDEAVRLRKDGRLGEAIKVWKRRLALVREIVGTEYAESVAGSLEILAEMQQVNADHTGTVRSLQGVVDIREHLLGKAHWRVTDARLALVRAGQSAKRSAEDRGRLKEIDSLRLRAFRAFKARDYAEAGKWEQNAVDLQRAVFGDDAPEVATGLGNMAFFAQMRGDQIAARRFYEQALALRRKVLGAHPDTARSLRDLATVLTQAGRRDEALRCQEEAVGLFTRTLGESHAESVQALGGLASTRGLLGEYGAAVADRERLVRIQRDLHGAGSRVVADELVKLAQVRGSAGNLDAGRKCLEEASAIYRRQPKEKDVELAECLAQLGAFHFGIGDDNSARACHEEAYRLRLRAAGENDLRTLDSLAALATVLQKQGNFTAARRNLERVVNAYRKAHGQAPIVAHQLLALARLLIEEEPKTAQHLLDEALGIWQAEGDKGWQPERGQTLAMMARLAAHQGQWDEAGRHMDQGRRTVRPFLARALGGLAMTEQLGYLSLADRIDFRTALALGLARPEDTTLAERSAGWLRNGKGVTLESQASALLLSRRNADPKLTDNKPAVPAWVELAEVRRALSAGAVLIDLARFEAFDFKAGAGEKKWQAPHYVAWITPKEGRVHLIDLGAASRIDSAVKAVREELQGTLKRIGDGEEKAEKALRKHLDVLSKLLLAPLLPHVGKTERWLISPDANLWLVPWEALLLPDGKYAVEKHLISYLSSGRDLLVVSAKAKASAPLVLADPDFDLEPEQAEAEARRLRGASSPATRGLPSDSLPLGKVRRLPGSAAEAKAITPSLKAYTGTAPHVFTGAQALEAVVKAARGPRVLVLCTHGFALPDLETNRDPNSLLGLIGTKAPTGWENPLLRCGLLLAGCNKAAKRAGTDDGVLTGLEVLGVDLHGTELVVLSACETGLGEVQSGEGVAGLRQAFQLAGAKAVVSTLWKIPDAQSARLMALFFQNLSRGNGRAEALRAAKRKIIDERREDLDAAHPFFWAGFTLTGEP